MTAQPLESLLKQCVTRGRVLTAPAQLAGYDADGIGYKTFRPDAVVIPADADELVRIFQQARLWNVPVCVRGAGTSLSGGPVAAQGGVVVHTSALRGIRTVHREGFWCEVECSVTLHQLEEALRPHGLFYPPDPSSGPVCTIGGNVAMNAGGAHCFRYGVTSNYVLGVEAVAADGALLDEIGWLLASYASTSRTGHEGARGRPRPPRRGAGAHGHHARGGALIGPQAGAVGHRKEARGGVHREGALRGLQRQVRVARAHVRRV